MQVAVEFLHQLAVVVARTLGKAFNIQRDALVLIGRQERHQLVAEALPRAGIGQELGGHLRIPLVGDGIETLLTRGKTSVCAFSPFRKAITFSSIGRGLPFVVHDVEERVQLGDRLQAAVGGQHVHPLGKQQVDLRVVLLQRGEAGGVPLHVERAANTFVGVQHHLRGRPLGLAVGVQRGAAACASGCPSARDKAS